MIRLKTFQKEPVLLAQLLNISWPESHYGFGVTK